MPKHPRRAGIRGIVLDAVGTLIDPHPPVAEVYASVARRQGVALELGAIKERFGRHFRQDELDEANGPLATDESLEYARWRRIVASVLPEVPDPDRAFEELWDHFGRPEAWRCYRDVGPALARFRRAGLALAIGSNFDARLRTVVEGLPEIRSLGESLIISSEVGRRKPHPAFYLAACGRLGLAPSEVLFVGDDPRNDAEGPHGAGSRGVLVDRHGRGPAGVEAYDDLVGVAANWED